VVLALPFFFLPSSFEEEGTGFGGKFFFFSLKVVHFSPSERVEIHSCINDALFPPHSTFPASNPEGVSYSPFLPARLFSSLIADRICNRVSANLTHFPSSAVPRLGVKAKGTRSVFFFSRRASPLVADIQLGRMVITPSFFPSSRIKKAK